MYVWSSLFWQWLAAVLLWRTAAGAVVISRVAAALISRAACHTCRRSILPLPFIHHHFRRFIPPHHFIPLHHFRRFTPLRLFIPLSDQVTRVTSEVLARDRPIGV